MNAGVVQTMSETLHGASLSPHIMRFMAHFVLFLKQLEKVSISDVVSLFILSVAINS